MSNFLLSKLMDACRQGGCPVCRMEQQSVERFLENQFYENVNSPRWRDRLRGSLGFCHEHAWLAVDRRLGDALGFSIIYRDLLNTILKRLDEKNGPQPASPSWTDRLRKPPEQTRALMERFLYAITPARACPVCEHRDEKAREILSVLVTGLEGQDVVDALRSSDGLCLPHLQQSLERAKDAASIEKLLLLQRGKMEGLIAELDEFIRKNDYQVQESFGREGDAWLRAIALVVGARKGR
ncbi:MAG: DUF6062 family protein [Bacteroidota bacterium]